LKNKKPQPNQLLKHKNKNELYLISN